MTTNLIITGFLLFTVANNAFAQQDADIVYKNGQIYTVNYRLPWAQSVAIKSDRFLYVGTDKDVASFIGPKTRVVDLKGKMAMPGIHDAHQHFGVSMREIGGNCRLRPASYADPAAGTVDKIIEGLKLCQEQGHTRGEWIVASVYRGGSFPGGQAHRRYIDAAFPDTPVYISAWAQGGLANSRALEIAGIDRNTPDPDSGKIVRDEKGEPTGELVHGAASLVRKNIPPLPSEALRDAVLRTARLCHQFGITSAQNAASTEALLSEIKKLDEQGQWALRVMTHLRVNRSGGGHMPLAEVERVTASYKSPHLDTDAVKIFVDGSPLQPHNADVDIDAAGNIPVERLRQSPETLNRLVTDFDRMGFKVKMHAVGTAATRTAVNAIAAARKANGDSGIYHEITHSIRYKAVDIPRLSKLNAVAEMSPGIWQIRGPLTANLLTANLPKAYQFRTVLDHNTLMTIGSDWVILPEPNLFPALSGLVDHGDESINLHEAIKAMTLNGAIAVGKQKTYGSIEVGKSADMIVLDRNLFEIPPAQIADTLVLETVFEGQVVYQAEQYEQ